MAKNQQLDPRDYEAAESPVDIESADHKFVLLEGEEKPQPVSLITAKEQELRDLRAQYKKFYGYKPVGKTAEELRAIIETAEHRAALQRDGIL